MSTDNYPNRVTLRKANDIYLSVMRSFIKHNLRQVKGERVEDLIREALHENQLDKFDEMLEEHNNVEFAIDFNFIPQIINRQWEYVKQEFSYDLVNQSRLWLIRHGRNRCEHIGPDLDAEFTRTNLYTIAELLGQIGRHDKQKQVEEIRDKFLTNSANDQISEISERLYAEEEKKNEFRKELTEKKRQLQELEKERSKDREKIEELKKVENEKNKIEKEKLDLSVNLKKLSTELKETEKLWQDSEDNLKNTKDDLEKVEKEKNGFKERVAELELQCDEVIKQKIEYEKRLNALGKELDIIKSAKETADEQVAVLQNLLSTISIDNLKAGLVYPPINGDSKFHIIDRRNTEKKNYLLQLLELKKPTLIYVQDDEMINNFMKLVGPVKWDVIGRHYRYTTVAEEKELLKKLKNGELIAIVSSDVLSTLATTHCVEHFVFCHLSHSLENIVERCKPAYISSQNAFLHLIYNNDDREKNNNWLTKEYPIHEYPKRTELVDLYNVLKDLIGINDQYITPKEVYEKISMDELKVQTSFAIFEELGLLEKNVVGIKLLEAKRKNLEKSKVFCKGEKLRSQKQEVLEFYDSQLDQTVVEFWEVINENIPSVTDKNNTPEITKSSEIADKLAQTHVHKG